MCSCMAASTFLMFQHKAAKTGAFMYFLFVCVCQMACISCTLQTNQLEAVRGCGGHGHCGLLLSAAPFRGRHSESSSAISHRLLHPFLSHQPSACRPSLHPWALSLIFRFSSCLAASSSMSNMSYICYPCSSHVQVLQDGSEICCAVWFVDSSADKKTGGGAGGDKFEDGSD